MTTFELPGCEDMWTVIGTLNNDEQIKTETEGSHAFLILSQEDSTMVNIRNFFKYYFSPSFDNDYYVLISFCQRFCKRVKRLMN